MSEAAKAAKNAREEHKEFVRGKSQKYPDFTPELFEIRKNGITFEMLDRLIKKHEPNALYNKRLYDRYTSVWGSVPIQDREPRYPSDSKPINNKLCNDFFGEIVNFKVGYLAGKPWAYGYAVTDEAKKSTGQKQRDAEYIRSLPGGEEAVKIASKALTDFTTRNNMYGCDMEMVTRCSICGYCGRLMYMDGEQARIMILHAYETIILSERSIAEPEYALRYFTKKNYEGAETLCAYFYDDKLIRRFEKTNNVWAEKETVSHTFSKCPLQGIENNSQLMGDAENVITLIDSYDKGVSDNANDSESFSNAYMVFKNLNVDKNAIAEAQKSGAFMFDSISDNPSDIYYLTKNINDAFTEHHLERLRKNIYRFSATPDLNDENFGNSSGQALRFKLSALETKCGKSQAKIMDANVYMWEVLAGAWQKLSIPFDPLQVVTTFKRNFPLDLESEARAVATLISCGFPKREAFSILSLVEDPDYIMELIDAEIGGEDDYEDMPIEEAHILAEKMQKYIARTEDGDANAANIT